MIRPSRWCLLLLLVLSGCGSPEHVGSLRYGAHGGINGFDTLKEVVGNRGRMLTSPGVGSHLMDSDVVIHVADNFELHDDEFWHWIEEWLAHRPDHRAVVILRDRSVDAVLLRRWAREYRAQAVRMGDPQQRERIQRLADYLDRKAGNEPGPPLDAGNQRSHGPIDVRGIAPTPPDFLTGHAPFADTPTVPQLLRTSQVLSGGADQWSWLLSRVEGPLVGLRKAHVSGSVHVHSQDGEHGRLLAVAGASWLTDGALVDPAARDLLASLVMEMVPEPGTRVAWVRSAQVIDHHFLGTPTISSMLQYPPVAILAAHLVVLLAFALLWRARWIGRRHRPSDTLSPDFKRHIEATARLLKRTGGVRIAESKLARWFGRPPAEPAPQADDLSTDHDHDTEASSREAVAEVPTGTLQRVRAWYPTEHKDAPP